MVTFVTTVSAVRKEAVLFSPPVDTLIYQRLHGFAQIFALGEKAFRVHFFPCVGANNIKHQSSTYFNFLSKEI